MVRYQITRRLLISGILVETGVRGRSGLTVSAGRRGFATLVFILRAVVSCITRPACTDGATCNTVRGECSSIYTSTEQNYVKVTFSKLPCNWHAHEVLN